jgi:hypothetical protein
MLGFGRFGQHFLYEYMRRLNSNFNIGIISINAENEWEHFLLSCKNKKNRIPVDINSNKFVTNNQCTQLIQKIIHEDQPYSSVLWVFGTDDPDINIQSATLVKQFHEVYFNESEQKQNLFMLIRTKISNNSHEEMIHKMNTHYALIPTYDVIGDYFDKIISETELIN